MKGTEYISLGKDCCIAYHLQRLGYRKNAYPFDWLLQKDIYSLVENDFKDFLNPKYLEYKNNVLNSFLSKDDDTSIEKGETVTMRVINTKYKIHFLHDFTTHENKHGLETELDKIIEKYNRRILRFYETMRDKNIQKILYIISPEKDFPRLNSLFIQKAFDNFNIRSIYSEIPTTSWKREEWDWDTFLFHKK